MRRGGRRSKGRGREARLQAGGVWEWTGGDVEGGGCEEGGVHGEGGGKANMPTPKASMRRGKREGSGEGVQVIVAVETGTGMVMRQVVKRR